MTPATGEVSSTVQAVPGAVWHLTRLPDGRVLVGSHGASGSNPVSVVDLATGTVSVLLDGVLSRYRHAVSPNGELVAVGQQDGLVPLVELATGRVRATLHADDGPTLGVAFSPDGQTLATTGYAGRVVLWDVPTATRLRAVDQHGGIGANVVFTPDGSTLLSVGESHDIGVLRLDLPARLAAARSTLVHGGDRGAAFAALGWWERIVAEPDMQPEVAASARRALGLSPGSADTYRVPPASPTTRSHPFTSAGSVSTSSTVPPASASRCSACSSDAMSAGCSPIDGSSST